MRVNLTALFVESAKPAPSGARLDYWDSHLPGFGLRVADSGRRTWTVFYRHRGRVRRLTLGTYPTLSLAEARTLARKALRDNQNGLDPAGIKQRERQADTFADLAALYLERHAKIKKRSWQEDARIIKSELVPAWGNRKVSDIARKDVIALLDKIVERGAGVMANRTRALISKIYNFAILDRGMVESNPAYKVANPGEEHQRDRVLSATEIKTLWKALDSEPPQIAAPFKLALLTAQRRGEVLGMAWSELDPDGGWWTIPAERSKNKLSHRVPLAPQASAILRERRAQITVETPYVFPGPRGKPISNPQKWLRRIKKTSGFDFKFHDLRRTAASLMTGIGVDRLVVSKILNHVERSITAVYDRHSYDSEKRTALTRWDRWLNAAISNEPADSKVVALR